MKILFIALFIISLTGCVSATYSPPKTDNSNKGSIVVNKSYDQTWDELIKYAGGAFFSINNYEKDSGLITLNFGSSNPSEFITGGNWKFKNMAMTFEGDYVDYLSQYSGARLDGKMNIVVARMGKQKTKITVHARYILTTPTTYGQYGNAYYGPTFAFDTGSCGTSKVSNKASGTQETRTICPTYVAEMAVINALTNMVKN